MTSLQNIEWHLNAVLPCLIAGGHPYVELHSCFRVGEKAQTSTTASRIHQISSGSPKEESLYTVGGYKYYYSST